MEMTEILSGKFTQFIAVMLIMALVNVAKGTAINERSLPGWSYPYLAMVLGVVLAAGVFRQQGADPVATVMLTVVHGLILGLVAAGVFSGMKATLDR